MKQQEDQRDLYTISATAHRLSFSARHINELVSAPADSVAWLAEALPTAPRRVSVMNGPQSERKYQDIARSLGTDELDAHLAGRTTYAATLDRDGLARLGVIDIDHGGESAILAVYRLIRAAGLQAWYVRTETPGGHTGGHIFVLYAAWVPAAHIAAQLASIAPGHEVWPSRQVIRLPFGYHRRAHTFGLFGCLGDSGELHDFNLDDEHQRAAALALVMSLPTNAAPPVPAPKPEAKAPQPPARRVSPGEASAEQLSGLDIIRRFKAEYTEANMLQQFGETEIRPSYWTCHCGANHTHNATLFISHKTGRIFSFSPNCRFYSDRGLDAFAFYTLAWHHGDRSAALKAYHPLPARQKAAQPPHAASVPEYLTPADAERRKYDRERKQAQRRQDTHDRLSSARHTLSTMEPNSRAARLLAVLIEKCEQHRIAACRPSNAELAERLGTTERTIQRAFNDLTELQIGTRSGGRVVRNRAGDVVQSDTAVWSFNAPDAYRVTGTAESAPEAEQPRQDAESTEVPNVCVTLIDITCDLDLEPKEACERAPESAAEPDTINAGELRYAFGLAAELAEPTAALEALSLPELRQWIETAEQRLTQPAPALQPRGAFLSPKERWERSAEGQAWRDSLWQLAPEPLDVADMAEQEQVTMAILPKPAPAERDPLATYRTKLNTMTMEQLAGERAKHRSIERNRPNAPYLAEVRKRLALAEAEILKRGTEAGLSEAPGTATARGSQAQRVLAAPVSAQLALAL